MDSQYQSAVKHVEQIIFKIKDLVDDQGHSLAQALTHESQQIFSELKQKKNPRSIESRVKSVQNILDDIRSQGEAIMDVHHTDYFRNLYDQLTQNLRKFDNY